MFASALDKIMESVSTGVGPVRRELIVEKEQEIAKKIPGGWPGSSRSKHFRFEASDVASLEHVSYCNTSYWCWHEE